MIVKICGITCLEDAYIAVEAGADMLGFNFYRPSPRSISPESCAQILHKLKNDKRTFQAIGVFVNEPRQVIYDIMEHCGLDQAQLSGDEPPELLSVLDCRGFKAIRECNSDKALEDARLFARQKCEPALLLDAAHSNQYGGTGQVADWQTGHMLAERFPILLAGGLTPLNVAGAIKKVKPWGVDVASGVEARPGRKDPNKLIDFIKAAQGQETEDQ